MKQYALTAAALGVSAFVLVRLIPSSIAAEEVESTQRHMEMLEQYCSDCHNAIEFSGDMAIEFLDPQTLEKDAKVWEAVVRKLRGRMMPPPGNEQPEQEAIDALVSWAETRLDAVAARHPHPGYIGLRRMNRTQYGHAVEDLLGLKIDPAELLPKDIQTEGFDNVAGGLKISPSFMEQYVAAAREISRRAVGGLEGPPGSWTFRAPPEEQALHKDGLPLGTRGGMVVEHVFPADGEYRFNFNLAVADQRGGVNAGYVSGLDHRHEVILTVDGKRVFEGALGGPEELKASDQDQQATAQKRRERFSNIRVKIPAGPHRVGVAFVSKGFGESDNPLQPVRPGAGTERLPRLLAFDVTGPFDPTGITPTPSRQRIFTCQPRRPAEEATCATQIVTQLARRAYRRPVTDKDVDGPMRFYNAARQSGTFDDGIQAALTAILASPKFLYRAESAPADAKPGSIHALSDLELASRLSFFLWSQGPDDELLDVAQSGKLRDPKVMEQQVERMLADPRSRTLVTNFASQWLQVRKMDEIDPDPVLYPEFDISLREAFRREVELFVDSILRSNRSVVDLLTADHTYVNERLAVHYGIQNIRGDQFRRIQLADSSRWGILGKGSILMATSYGNRTAPVLRGAWILENITGTPPQAPPPGVEALKENIAGARPTTVRERLEAHRENPSCNGCHGVMDPLGFALENFDSIGRWRDKDREALTVIDATGQLADGTPLQGPDDLRKALIRRPEQFVQTLTEKLMIYALGRTVEHHDMPIVRQIVRDAARDEYRFSSIVLGIVNSAPFRMVQIPTEETPADESGTKSSAEQSTTAQSSTLQTSAPGIAASATAARGEQ